MGDEDEEGFAVKDKRRFDAEGKSRDDADGASSNDAEVAREGGLDGEQQSSAASEAQELPEIDFSTFVLSLSTSAMVHLGESPGPGGEQAKDLPLAKQSIDILALLQDKTTGNLSADEQRLLREVLYDLRLRYVAATS